MLSDKKTRISTFYVFDFLPSAACPHSSLATDEVSIWLMKKNCIGQLKCISIGHQECQCEKHASPVSGLTGWRKGEGGKKRE